MLHGHSFTTDEIAPRERALAWCDWMAKLFHGVTSDLYGDRGFDGHIRTLHAGEVVMTRLEANRHRIIRSPKLTLHDDAQYLKIVAPWKGEASIEQYGHQSWVRPGGWAIYDITSSYEVATPKRAQHLIVMLPKEQVAAHGLRLESLMGRHIGGETGIARIALETMRTTYREIANMTPEAAQGAGELITQLVSLALKERVGWNHAARHMDAFKARILDYIARHLRDPDLSITRIAEVMKCSKRSLHNAFAGEEETLAHYIQHQRLQACMQDLKNPMFLGRTITDIAFSWGFQNSAHFSRVFHDYTGMSPRAYRQSLQVPDAE